MSTTQKAAGGALAAMMLLAPTVGLASERDWYRDRDGRDRWGDRRDRWGDRRHRNVMCYRLNNNRWDRDYYWGSHWNNWGRNAVYACRDRRGNWFLVYGNNWYRWGDHNRWDRWNWDDNSWDNWDW